jgi:hypothetical protein
MVAMVATNKATNLLRSLASDRIRIIFPPNIPGRRLIAGIAGTFHCRMWRARSTQVACDTGGIIETRFKTSSPLFDDED